MGKGAKAVVGMAGFLILGLSPSFVDWQQEPEKRTQIYLYYLAAALLIYLGVFS